MMEKYITDERTGLKYELVGGYYLIAGNDEPEGDPLIGVWGQRHLRYLKEHHRVRYLFEIITALQTIGAHEYHDLLLKIVNDDFGGVRFPLDDNQLEQMQPEIEDINRAFWNNKNAEAEFHEAVANFLMANLNDSDHVF